MCEGRKTNCPILIGWSEDRPSPVFPTDIDSSCAREAGCARNISCQVLDSNARKVQRRNRSRVSQGIHRMSFALEDAVPTVLLAPAWQQGAANQNIKAPDKRDNFSSSQRILR